MASVLGVHISRVKIVSVYEGSLNVDMQILDDPDKLVTNTNGTSTTSSTTATDMAALQTKLVSTLQGAGAEVLGAKVLDVQAEIKSTVVVNRIAKATLLQQGGALAGLALGMAASMAALLAFMF
jgi:hypothetical protein